MITFIWFAIKAFFSKDMILGTMRFLASPAGTVFMIVCAFVAGAVWNGHKRDVHWRAVIAQSQQRAKEIDQKIDAALTRTHDEDLAAAKALADEQQRSLDDYAKNLPTDACAGTPADDDFLNGVSNHDRPVQQPRTPAPGGRKDIPARRRSDYGGPPSQAPWGALSPVFKAYSELGR